MTSVPEARVSVPQRLWRALLGLCLGWVWSSVLGLACLGVVAAWYGGIDTGLSRVKDAPWGATAVCGLFGAVAAIYAASAVSPFMVGGGLRWPVRTSSFLAALVGAVVGALDGALVGDAAEPGAEGRKAAAELAVELGIAGGIVTGLVVGYWLTRRAPHLRAIRPVS
ncbi:hypothetical protein [Gemmata sp.]|uniref:hypothetical protein n=1 Tax=Gemmata sp. TaxID=1914242 RepID=UPI003F722FCB